MKIHIMLAIVCVASAKNLNINENYETEYYIDYIQNSNVTEEIYGSSKFTKVVLDFFSNIEQFFQRRIDKDVENTKLRNIDIKNKSNNINDENNKAEETITEATPIELYNKTIIKRLNDTDAIVVDGNDKQADIVPDELKIVDTTPEYNKNQTKLNVSNDIDDLDTIDNCTNKEELTELSSSQADLNESNTETTDRQDKDHNNDVAFKIIKPEELIIDEPHFKDSEVQPVTMPGELLVGDASKQVLHNNVSNPDIDLNTTKSRDSKKIDYSIDVDDDGKRAVSLEGHKPQSPIPEAPPVDHGSTQVGLNCLYNKALGCLSDADDGRRPVSFEVFLTEQPIPNPPSVEHGSSQAGLNYTIYKRTDISNNHNQEDSTEKTITTTKVSTALVASTEVSTADVSTTDESTTGVSTTEVSAAGVSTTEVSIAGVSTTELSDTGVSSTKVSTAGVSTTEVSDTGVSSTEVSTAGVSTTEVSIAGVSTTEVSDTGVSSTEVSTAGVSTTEVSDYDKFLLSYTKKLNDKKRKDVLPDIGTA